MRNRRFGVGYAQFRANNMNILLVKTSSLGDVIHNLPVASDIRRHFPDAQIDWVVEESFAAIPSLHPAVRQVQTVAVRRWRKNLWAGGTWHEMHACKQRLQSRSYDIVLDTQGLLKSAVIAGLAHGLHCGYDRASAREALAARFYQRTFKVSRALHAVERNRLLAAQALGYEMGGAADYGILAPLTTLDWLPPQPYAVLLHATSGAYKLWQESEWVALGAFFARSGLRCVLPWGDEAEHVRSNCLAGQIRDALVAPQLNLNEAAALLGSASAVVGVDTGLTHLAAALGVPTVGVYCATDPAATGIYGAPCALNLGGIGQRPTADQVVAGLARVMS